MFLSGFTTAKNETNRLFICPYTIKYHTVEAVGLSSYDFREYENFETIS